MATPPILDHKHHAAPSVFVPAALLREGRRQKRLSRVDVPAVCILDPDGDLAHALRQSKRSTPFAGWPCYHTDMDVFEIDKRPVGIIGRVVGAPFAVLVAEELFASGCRLLLNLTSAGRIVPAGEPPYFVVIDRALRDEGTSYHYAPPSEFSEADATLVAAAVSAVSRTGLTVTVGPSWTTDAPFRETAQAIEAARAKGILAVEMEAAALYAYARAAGVRILCLAHVTNTMAQSGDDFEKGEAGGADSALAALAAIVGALRV